MIVAGTLLSTSPELALRRLRTSMMSVAKGIFRGVGIGWRDRHVPYIPRTRPAKARRLRRASKRISPANLASSMIVDWTSHTSCIMHDR